jgi:Gas vesicle protein K
MQLVLTLIEFIRQLLERQALRRVDNGTLARSKSNGSAPP